MAYETEITILGGLPVTVEYEVQPAEPDVGIREAYVDDWAIVAVAGRAPKKVTPKSFNWLYKRIDATKNEINRIMDALEEDFGDRRYDY